MADGEKGNTTVARATCLYICCSIVYNQLPKSRDSGCDKGTDNRNEHDGSCSEGHGEEDKYELVKQSTCLSQDCNEDQSVCDGEGHSGSMKMTIMNAVMMQAGKAEETAVIATAIVVVMVNDCDTFNDDHGLAGISNSDDSDHYNGGVWDSANAAEGAACGGSNSGGSASSIRDGMGVDGTSC